MHGVRSAFVIRGLVVGLTAVATLAGCGAGGDSDAARQTFDPGAAAAAIRAQGTVTVAGSASVPGHRVSIGGRIAYRPYRAVLQIPVSSAGYLAAVQYRRIDRQAWVRRAVVSTPGVASFGVPLLAFRSSAQAPFVALDHLDEGPALRIALPYDPAQLLDVLARDRHVRFHTVPTRTGTDSGHATFRAELRADARVRSGLSSVLVETDRRSVPVAMRLTTPGGLTSDYTVKQAKARAVAVASPPRSQIEVTGVPLPDAVDAYADVATVTAAGVPVTVQRAAGRDGWTCFRVVSSPPYAGVPTARPSGGVCVPPASDAESAEDRIQLPVDADASTPYDLIGAIVPAGSTVSVETVDGKSSPVPVGPSGLALYAGDPAAPAVLLTVTVPGGATVVCAPGAVNGAGDVSEVASTTAVRGAPWNCLPQELADLLAG